MQRSTAVERSRGAKLWGETVRPRDRLEGQTRKCIHPHDMLADEKANSHRGRVTRNGKSRRISDGRRGVEVRVWCCNAQPCRHYTRVYEQRCKHLHIIPPGRPPATGIVRD